MSNNSVQKTKVKWPAWRWPLVAVFSVLLTACGGPTPEQKVLAHTAQKIIVPLYTALSSEAVELTERASAFCASPDVESQQALQEQWRITMEAWAAVQPIDFGPLEDGNLRWKLHFWPDRKDITRKKVEGILDGEDELTVERVSAGSVSIQGLAALEYLLFDTQGSALAKYEEARRCELLQAIAGRIDHVTKQLVEEWVGGEQQVGFADVFSTPGAENSRYPDDNAALAALFGSLVVGTEVVKRNKLGIPLNNGKGALKAKPYRLEAWRSQHSLPLVQASMATLETLFRGKEGEGVSAYLSAQSAVEPALLEEIDGDFIAVNEQFSNLKSPVFSQIKEEAYYSELVELHRRLGSLQRNLSQLPERLGINLGFNSNDGD